MSPLYSHHENSYIENDFSLEALAVLKDSVMLQLSMFRTNPDF